jgi:hypothetical protein
MTIKTALDTLVAELPKRQKDIIVQRFGIGSAKPKTLAFLGSKYGITRERVRQIESVALKALHKAAEGGDLAGYAKKAIAHIETMGGVRREDFLVEDLKLVFKDQDLTAPYATLLFSIYRKPMYFSENEEFFGFWYTDSKYVKEMKQFAGKVGQFIRNKKEALIERKKFDEIFAQITNQHSIKEPVALNYLLNSKKFSVNAFGDFGLVEWPEIMPKTVRDKSYLILKKRKEPMHFRDIAQEINKMKFDKKKAHPQTVHNEVIKDNRFVLVGRGLYSLKEFGIEAGTTREVLQRIIKKNGPLPLDKIIQLVSQQRVLKYNTIFLNLQNKKFFKKKTDGFYHLA